MFHDRARIQVKAGDGGHGCIAFRREKFVPRGGPSGGDGGRGGDVYLLAEPTLVTLRDFRYRTSYSAGRGDHGGGSKRSGSDGEDLILKVPVGTQVFDAATGELLGDLIEPGQRLRVAAGGRGGRGNAHFATPTDRAPHRAEDGVLGGAREIQLELKLLADVGLVGLPNAGKSSLLASVTRASPKIADYPFTTVEPNLGLVETPVGGPPPFVVADIPGLIEGAHAGAGLGHQFLRHIERTRVLLYVVDAASTTPGGPLADLETVRREVRLYSGRLVGRPGLVVLNKIDLPEARMRLEDLQGALRRQGDESFAVSAATGEGMDGLMRRTGELLAGASPDLDEMPRDEP
ncbi:MAG: GTPase ObgE [Bacillota bacterium]|nr:GTPase ObgE [Bacillota bacterium]